jgi:DNA invertase Pin-like site-specific DNA recombinase
MNSLLIGYARVSTDAQDLTAQQDALAALGVSAERTYLDHGLSGTNRDRPGLREALAACRAGDTLVVTKLDRLARSLPDARSIIDDLTRRDVKLSFGNVVHDPTDPVGRLLFNVLAMVAEFEADLIRLRTREGMKVAKAKGRLRGKQPKLSVRQEAHPRRVTRHGRLQRRRAGRAVRCGPLNGVPGHRTRHPPADPSSAGRLDSPDRVLVAERLPGRPEGRGPGCSGGPSRAWRMSWFSPGGSGSEVVGRYGHSAKQSGTPGGAVRRVQRVAGEGC